jgi:hypothetical protein
VIDNQGQVAMSATCTANWSYFTITGTVTDSHHTCVGGTTPGSACAVDGDCPGSITPPVAPGTCTGIVNVAGADVRVTSTTNGLVAGSAITLANGTYTVGSLKPGSYNVFVSKPGYTFTAPAGNPYTVGPNASLVNSVGTSSLSHVRPPKVKTKNPDPLPIALPVAPSVR